LWDNICSPGGAAQRGFLGRSGNGAKWRGFYFFRDFWAVPGMAQNGADIIFSGILGRSGNGAKWRGYYFFRDFGPFGNGAKWRGFYFFRAFLGRSGNGAIYHILPQDVFSTTTVNLGKILTE